MSSDMLSREEYGIIAIAERAKRLGLAKKHNLRIIQKAADIIEEKGLTQEQVEEIYKKFVEGA